MVAPLFARAHDDVDDGPSTWFDDDDIAAARVRAIPLGSRVLAYTPTESVKASNWTKCDLQAVENPLAEHCGAAKLAAADAAGEDGAGATSTANWWNATKWAAAKKLNAIVRVWQGDITHLCVDAIQNAANVGLKAGGGICGAIHKTAGPELARACFQYPETLSKADYVGGKSPAPGGFAPRRCAVGETRLTPGFDLHARAVLHTIGPQGVKPDELRASYRSALDETVAHGLRTVALCAISTGTSRDATLSHNAWC